MTEIEIECREAIEYASQHVPTQTEIECREAWGRAEDQHLHDMSAYDKNRRWWPHGSIVHGGPQ